MIYLKSLDSSTWKNRYRKVDCLFDRGAIWIEANQLDLKLDLLHHAVVRIG
jgi:hypothetical protein